MAQADIHPKYYKTNITCITCNAQFVSGSTKGTEIRIDICSKCHSFYTGKQTFVSAKGRVERFLNKASKKVELKPEQKQTKTIKARTNKTISLENLRPTEKSKPIDEKK